MNHWYLVFLDIFSVIRWLLPLMISIIWWEMSKAMFKDQNPAAINLFLAGTALFGFMYYSTLTHMEPGVFWIKP